jgi:hypothetical protein
MFSVKRTPGRFICFFSAIAFLLSSILLVACSPSFPFGGKQGSPTATATPSSLAISQVQWCGKPSMLFRDEGAITPIATARATPGVTATASTTTTVTPGVTATGTAQSTGTPTATVVPGTPRTITDWSEVEANLGFTVYLPPTLPTGTCLVNAQATIHDPIIGGSFTIGYLLPDHSALTLSEAPLISQNTTFQCNPSNGTTPHATTPSAGTPVVSPTTTQQVPVLLCSGAKGTTNIVMSARGSSEQLQQIFQSLQPGLSWIPAS